MRDDVYLLYLVFRTLDDLVDEGRSEAAERVAAVEAWAAGDPSARTPEVDILDDLGRRHPLPRRRWPTSARECARTSPATASPPRQDVDRYCYRVAGTVGLVMAVRARDLAR